MNFAFSKTPSFIFGLLLFILIVSIATVPLHLKIYYKVFILSGAVALYFFSEYYRYKHLTDKLIANEIKRLLSTAQEFSSKFGQRIRSNIFFSKKRNKKTYYYIKHYYNMETFNDKNIEIPENMGCTGEAWRTKSQVWGDKEMIFSRGRLRIPDEQLEKVPEDLQWVCSTPIVDKNGNVIAVMNFDGNGDLTPMQVEEIKTRCHIICEELKNIIL